MTTRTARTITALGALAAVTLGATTSAAAAGAEAITVHERGVDVNPDSQNPCTLVLGTVIDVNDIHFHITTGPDGSIEENGHNTADVTFIPDDPSEPTYHGRETYAFHLTGDARVTSSSTTFHVRMKGTDGNWLALHETAHFTVVGDGVVVDFDRPTMTCS
jgi:hypothetical protein